MTIDLTLGLARLEADSSKASQIIVRDTDKMARATAKADAAVRRYAQSFAAVGIESKVIQAAAAGASDGALKLFAGIEAGGSELARVGAVGGAAFREIGSAAETAVGSAQQRILQLAEKVRQVKDQAAALTKTAVGDNEAGRLSDDGLKQRLAAIRAVESAELERVATAARADSEARRAAAADLASAEARRSAALKIIDAQNGLTASYRQQLQQLRELRDAGALTPAQFKQAGADLVAKQPAVRTRATEQESAAAADLAQRAAADAAAKAAAAQALATAQVGNATATAAAQAQAYAGFLITQAAAAENAARAEARQAEVTSAIAAASERARVAQVAAYETKTTFIARVNEEAQALFRTAEAQRVLDAQRAGVGDGEARQLAKLSVDREFLAGINRQIEAQQKLADQFGKTEAEILRQQAAQRGLTNTAASAIGRFEALAVANKKAVDTQAATAANDAFVESVNRRAAAIGKTEGQVLAEQAAMKGLTKETQAAIAKITEFEGKTGQLGKGAFATRNQLLTLQYTISDVVASAASGISPLTILLQQGGQVAQIEGGISGVFRTALSVVTPFRLAVGGAATAVLALGYAFLEGAKQSKAFADGIVLSGNFAGITEGRFNALAKGISASGQISISAAREFTQALIETGEVGPKALQVSSEAAARFGAATGKSAKDVGAQFATLTRDVSAGATSLNQSLNFLTAAQLQQIRVLQDSGQSTEAYSLVVGALNDRLKGLEPNFGILDRALRGVTGAWRGFWDAAFDIGRTSTIEDKITAARAAAAAAQTVGSERLSQTQLDPQRRAQLASSNAQGVGPGEVAGENLRLLLRSQSAKEATAAEVAATADLDKKASAAAEYYRQAEKGSKSQIGLTRELAEEERNYQTLLKRKQTDPSVELPSSATRLAQQKKIRESYTDKGAVNDSDALRKARLDSDLEFLADNLAKQKDLLKFNQQELEAIYAASGISLKDYYDRREKITAAGIQRELNELTDAQAAIEVALEKGGFKNQVERVQLETKLQKTVAKSADIERDAAAAAKLAAFDRAAAVKVLTDRVSEYRAQLLQLEGDDAGAAAVRAQQAIAAAQLFAKTTQGSASPITDADVARQARAIDFANNFAEVQRRVGLITSDAARAEDLYLTLAARGGASLVEQDQAVYAIRSQSLVQLGVLAEKARELAAITTDPKIKAAAADLAVAYVKAVDTIDPALNRLRESSNQLASSIANDLTGLTSTGGNLKTQLRKIGNDLYSTFQKQFIAEPLKVQIQGTFQKFIDSDNPIAQALKKAAGVSEAADPQKTAALATAQALDALTAAAARATDALQPRAVGNTDLPTINAGGDNKFAADAANLGKAPSESGKDLSQSLDSTGDKTVTFGAVVSGVSPLLSQLGGASAQASSALRLLPLILQAAQGSSATGSGLASLFSKYFSSAGASSFADASLGSDIALAFHDGGVVGVGGSPRAVSSMAMKNAKRYHGGGIVKGAPTSGLATNEVPAVLMGGPKGKREEVLHADDPRHTDNLSPAAKAFMAAITSGSRVLRYHTGGIAGMMPAAQRPVVNRGYQWPPNQPAASEASESREAMRPLTVQVQAAPGMSRDSATQQGVRIGLGIQQQLRRRGG